MSTAPAGTQPATTPDGQVPDADGWPLLGRDEELRHIAETLHDRAGRGLVLYGAPGIGRSRLLHATIAEARAAGHRVERVAATHAAASVPLAALAHLLPAGAADQHPFRAVAESLRDGPRPALLAVDDAHALDGASAALVHQLALHRAARVVVTVARGADAPDAIVALWKDGLAGRLDLGTLPDTVIDALVDTALAAGVTGTARAVLRRLASGNPRYLAELLRSARVGRVLRNLDGMWQWSGEPPGEGYLGELVAQRLRGCGPAGRRAVERVALGEPLPVALLENDAGLAEAEDAGLLAVTTDGRRHVVCLAEPVHAAVLRATLGPVRARAVYRALAAQLRATPLRRSEDTLRLGVWQSAAGTPVEAPLALAGARAAVRRLDLDHAEVLARTAGAASPAGRLLLADVLRWQGRPMESLDVLTEPPPASEPVDVRWRIGRAAALYWGLGHRARAHTELRTCATHPGTGPVRAMMLLCDGRCAQALAVAQTVLTATELPVDARLWAYTAAVLAAANLGRAELALSLAEGGLGLATAKPNEVLLGAEHLRIARAGAQLLAGHLRAAQGAAAEGYGTAADAGEPGLVADWAGLRGVIGQVTGDLVTAATALREAVALGARHDPVGLRGYHLAVLAGVLAQSGHPDAATVQAEADAVAASVPPLYQPQLQLNRARLAAASGEHARAAREALRAANLAADAGQPYIEAFALYDTARYGLPERVATRLTDLAHTLGTDLVAGYAQVARGLAGTEPDDPADVLADAAQRLEHLGALLAAAHAAMTASRAYRRDGRHRDAGRTQELALALDLRCRGAGVPWRTVGDATALTAREYEIAQLAASPMSSKEIARSLHLSERTVNNHLHRTYTKLGISGRSQLAAVLREDQLDRQH